VAGDAGSREGDLSSLESDTAEAAPSGDEEDTAKLRRNPFMEAAAAPGPQAPLDPDDELAGGLPFDASEPEPLFGVARRGRLRAAASAHPTTAAWTVLVGNAELARLADALVRASHLLLERESRMFQVDMLLDAQGEVALRQQSAMSPTSAAAWMQLMMAVGEELDRELRRGRIRGFGSCLNISNGDVYVPGEIPVLVVRLKHVDAGLLILRQHYEIVGGGDKIRFDDVRLTQAPDDAPRAPARGR
jgi:hypothetical protein